MHHFKTIADYCHAIQIPSPKHHHFDIRSFEENMPTVVHVMEPFRHEFYAIAIKAQGKGAAYTGHHKQFPTGSTIFFNSPFQILSWDIVPDWEGYYIMFTQDFISQSRYFSELLEDFPFLRIDRSIPFEIDENDLTVVVQVFEKIYAEYHSASHDKFQLIEVYVLLLLNYIRRYFAEQLPPETAAKELRKADLTLLSRFQSLIETSFQPGFIAPEEVSLHSVAYYAGQLNVHPNHLNAVVKTISGQTALQQIHYHILQLAKSYLAQTEMSVQEIAESLHFDSPNYFSRFFKKNTTVTPRTYRKQPL
ncbi:helix-turn-helix domain-containing protein [Chloroflexi bacterium TSY]|nr:helix-turn-helix domain-containing protein [Chloroflexi bacterium TSY]